MYNQCDFTLLCICIYTYMYITYMRSRTEAMTNYDILVCVHTYHMPCMHEKNWSDDGWCYEAYIHACIHAYIHVQEKNEVMTDHTCIHTCMHTYIHVQELKWSHDGWGNTSVAWHYIWGIYVYMSACMHACMYLRMYVMRLLGTTFEVCISVCMYVCMYIMRAYLCVYAFMRLWGGAYFP